MKPRQTQSVEAGYYETDLRRKSSPIPGDRTPTRFTYLQFCLVVWQMSQKNIHYNTFKAKYGPILKSLYLKGTDR